MAHLNGSRRSSFRTRSALSLGILSATLLVSLVVRADGNSDGVTAPKTRPASDPNVTSTGSFNLNIPLELPSPRGNDLPVPVAINYNGSTNLGHAGVGWDVQISSVRSITSRAYRPTDESRYELDLLGEHYVLYRVTSATNADGRGQYRPIVGAKNLVADYDGTVWTVRDDAGKIYTFSQLSGLDTWALDYIKDSHGNAVRLAYETTNFYPTVGLASPTSLRTDFVLRSVSYSNANTSSDRCFKYRVDFQYQPVTAVVNRAPAYAVTNRNGNLGNVMQVLKRVVVQSATSCESSAPLRTYLLGYSTDPELGLPLLKRVDQLGTAETDASKALPLVSYDYGSLTGATQSVKFTAGGTIPAPTSVAGGLWPSLSKSGRARVEMTDFTGDGVPDLVSRPNDDSLETWLYRGRPSAMGNHDLSFTQVPGERLSTSTSTITNPSLPSRVPGSFKSTFHQDLAWRRSMATAQISSSNTSTGMATDASTSSTPP